MRTSLLPGAARRAAAALGAALLVLGAAPSALAHGGITGPKDVVMDNAILVFLLATVLIGAGVLAWVTFSPRDDEDDEDDEEDLGEGDAPPTREAGAPGATAGDGTLGSAGEPESSPARR
jgi:hypothetical protein